MVLRLMNLMLMLRWRLALSLSLSLPLRLRLRLLLSGGLSLLGLLYRPHPQLVDILLRCQAQLRGVCDELLALHLGELLRRHASPCGLCGELLLHLLLYRSDLLGGRLAWSGHFGGEGIVRKPKSKGEGR